jgi:hypothetical protein
VMNAPANIVADSRTEESEVNIGNPFVLLCANPPSGPCQ